MILKIKRFKEKQIYNKMSNYKFTKTKWYYGYKKLKPTEVYRNIVLRIDKNYIQELRDKLNISEKQEFRCDKAQTDDTDFDMSDCPSYKNDNDIYGTNPSIRVLFKNEEEIKDFSKKIGLPITEKQKTLWFPQRVEPFKYPKNSYWTTKTVCNNKYPIYIVSYKRYDSLITVKSLLYCGVKDFYVVIKPEKSEIENYTKCLKKLGIEDKLLIVPKEFLEIEEKKGNGNSIPQRNYAYTHSIQNNFKWHWCLDDNIKDFFRREQGQQTKMKTGFMFYFVEQYLKRYKNVNLASLQYNHLSPAGGHRSIIIKNSKVYSCILIKNSNNIKWRGTYNEDIILTLDTLLEGKSTLTFQNFLCGKKSTGSTKGGNQEAYKGEGQQKKIDFLMKIHPTYCKEIVRYGHPHHKVNYNPFSNVDVGYNPIKLNFPELHMKQ